jgi:hypothetical protein
MPSNNNNNRKPPAKGRPLTDFSPLEGREMRHVEVKEGGESVWALWSEVERQQEVGFAETQPASRPPDSRPPDSRPPEDQRYAATAPMGLPTEEDTKPPPVTHAPSRKVTLDLLMVTARRNNRVCPRAVRWKELYDALGGPHAMHLPVPPIDDRAWRGVPPLQKRLVFREQLEWAERQGKLDLVSSFINALEESDWLHMGEA